MELTVRPFEIIIDSEGCTGYARGWLEKEGFIVELNVDGRISQKFDLDTLSVGTDEHGEYAIVSTGEREVQASWILSVEPEYDEDFPDCVGCCISYNYSPDRDHAEAIAYMHGIDPKKTNLLVPPRKGLAIYFNFAGKMDGYGSSLPTEEVESSRA